MSRKIEVVRYNPEWRTLNEAEAKKITNILECEVSKIHHIGSTAIAGILAKPIIDIMVEVHDIARIDALIFHSMPSLWIEIAMQLLHSEAAAKKAISNKP